MNNDFLHTLQSDVVAILRATPTLASVNVIPEDEGDMNAKISQLLGTMKSTNGSIGIMAVVMLPEVADAEANLPGPPMKALCQIQVIENTLMNRGNGGSCVRTSAAALYILQALQHHGLATHSIYARPSRPIEPVPVKKGHLSHMVAVEAKYSGLQSPGRPSAVTAQMGNALASASTVIGAGNAAILATANEPGTAGNALSVEIEIVPDSGELTVAQSDGKTTVTSGDKRVMRVTGSLLDKDGNPFVFDDMLFVSSDANESLWEAGDFGSGAYFSVGMNPVSGGWQFTLYYSLNGADTAEWKSEVFPTSGGAPIYPDLATTWTVFQERGEGTPTVTALAATAEQAIAHSQSALSVTLTLAAGSNGTDSLAAVAETSLAGGADASEILQLACATAEADIYFTTDGSYPTPHTGTLYQDPIPNLPGGTIVRAAAYAEGLLPGPLTEIEITE
jgi:hypothetical protein